MNSKPIYTQHFNQRMNHRGMTKKMIELVFTYGDIRNDKIFLNRKLIKHLINKCILDKKTLLKVLEKGGICLIYKNNCFITTYNYK